ncbi:MAG: peptidylprolyl isomerase [bacterium]|nr:peptidylprolyl isomerase [bacterium]
MYLRSIGLALLCLVLASPAAARSRVDIQTDLGLIGIELFDEVTPANVQNFLNYVNDGDYTNSFIHRAIPGFIIQGGAFTFQANSFFVVPSDPPVTGEVGISNTRGTIAIALPSDPNGIPLPDAGTSSWFINLADNTGLDPHFTVFGEVIVGMDVVDAISVLPTIVLNPLSTENPLKNWTVEDPLVFADHLVFSPAATEVSLPALPPIGFGALLLGTLALLCFGLRRT